MSKSDLFVGPNFIPVAEEIDGATIAEAIGVVAGIRRWIKEWKVLHGVGHVVAVAVLLEVCNECLDLHIIFQLGQTIFRRGKVIIIDA